MKKIIILLFLLLLSSFSQIHNHNRVFSDTLKYKNFNQGFIDSQEYFIATNDFLNLPLEYNIEKNSLVDNPITSNQLDIKDGEIMLPDGVSFGLSFDLSEMRKRSKIN